MTEEIKKNPFPNFLGKIERGTLEDAIDIAAITEKIDGSYFQFGWYNDEFRYRTKNTLDNEGIDKMFNKIIEYVVSVKNRFPKNTVFCGEYLQKKRHNKILYNNLETDWAFFVFHVHGNKIDSNIIMNSIDVCDNFYFIPLIRNMDVSKLNEMAESAYGGMREGVVIENSNGERFKYVTDHFKEVAHKKIVKQPKLVDDLFTPYIDGIKARTDKAIFRLKEQGIEIDKKQFGRIIGDTVNDLMIEERENIKEEIYKFYDKKFKSEVTKKIIEYLFEVFK